MYTDGVTEAMNIDYQQFGEERLEETLEDVAMHNCQEMVDAIKSDVAAFAGEAEQSDDITVLTLKRL
jgi:sigma-B regulation protein RsbU (phosphoserine phosphatase)